MSGFRVRVVRQQDNILVFDSEHEEGDLNVMFTDHPGPGVWSYVLQVRWIDTGFLGTLYTRRNAIASFVTNR